MLKDMYIVPMVNGNIINFIHYYFVPDAERDRPDNDGSVHVVVPRRNVFDVLNPDLFT